MKNHYMNKDLDYYLNLNWTLIEGIDLDFNQNPYHYIEIKELPNFVFCAKTRDLALQNYKKQLKLILMVMLEDKEPIPEPKDKNNMDKKSGRNSNDNESLSSKKFEEEDPLSSNVDDDDDDDNIDWEKICP